MMDMTFRKEKISLLKNISELVTLEGAAQKQGRRIQEKDLSIQKKFSVLNVNGRIEWIGPANKLPKIYAKKKIKEFDLKGHTVLPGLVECHTHSVFASSRSYEFEMRNQGMSYQEIAAQGGGILSTMKKTRSASAADLTKDLQKRVNVFAQQGVTTLEIKSGYALNLSGEVKVLEAIRKIKNIRTVPTFLGAHSLPPEFKTYEDYLIYLTEKVLPVIKKKKLANRVDIFIEKGFFPKNAGEIYLQKARDLGFEVLVHADQLSLSGGADVALKVQALSGDHLLKITENEIQKLGSSQVTCVLLPAADLYMKTNYPDARRLIEAGARVALATDFNPGTSPTQDIALVGLLARLEMKMSLPEVIAAYTVGASHALKLSQDVGSIELGKAADFMCTLNSWTDLFYSVGSLGTELTIAAGDLLHHKI